MDDGDGGVSTKMTARKILGRRKIRPIESNAKCRYLKKLTCKGTLRQVFFLLYDPILRPFYTLYACIQYTYSHREGGGGRANQRKG